MPGDGICTAQNIADEIYIVLNVAGRRKTEYVGPTGTKGLVHH